MLVPSYEDLIAKVGANELLLINELINNYILNGGTTYEPLDYRKGDGPLRSRSSYSDTILASMRFAKESGYRYWQDGTIDKYIRKYWDTNKGEHREKLVFHADWNGVVNFDILIPVFNLIAKNSNLTRNDMRSICLHANAGGYAYVSCVVKSVRCRELDQFGQFVADKYDTRGRRLNPVASRSPVFGAAVREDDFEWATPFGMAVMDIKSPQYQPLFWSYTLSNNRNWLGEWVVCANLALSGPFDYAHTLVVLNGVRPEEGFNSISLRNDIVSAETCFGDLPQLQQDVPPTDVNVSGPTVIEIADCCVLVDDLRIPELGFTRQGNLTMGSNLSPSAIIGTVAMLPVCNHQRMLHVLLYTKKVNDKPIIGLLRINKAKMVAPSGPPLPDDTHELLKLNVDHMELIMFDVERATKVVLEDTQFVNTLGQVVPDDSPGTLIRMQKCPICGNLIECTITMCPHCNRAGANNEDLLLFVYCSPDHEPYVMSLCMSALELSQIDKPKQMGEQIIDSVGRWSLALNLEVHGKGRSAAIQR